MKKSQQPNRFVLNFKFYGLAILVHVILLGIIMFNLFWNPTKKVKIGQAEVQTIQAQVIDETLLNQELDKIKEEQDLKLRQDIEKQKNLEELEQMTLMKQQEINKLEEEKKLSQEQSKREQQKAQELTEQRKLEEEKTRQAEEKRLTEEAKLKNLALEKEKQLKEKNKQLELAKKKKAEEIEKKRINEEQKKKKEAEKRKKQEQEKIRREAEKTTLAREQAESRAATLFSQYKGLIRNKVNNSWIRPGTVRPGAQAKVLVRVSPQGDVLTARIQRSSGDSIFDRSVINAVYKASPLPIPDDPMLYTYYRDFVFNFDPPG